MRARRHFLQHQPDVLKHRAFGMKIRRLLARHRGDDFGQNAGQQSAFEQQNQPARGVRRREQFDEFVANPLGADEFDFRRESS